jgi:uncharacterized metal-binding protein YceD (DUF177 family)
MTAELAWDHAISDIPDAGLTATRAAAPGELEAVARALGLVACERLEASYEIVPRGAGHYALKGTLRAKVVQACVVTLDPVTSLVEQDFQAGFWPEEEISPPTGGLVDLEEDSEPEPIVGGRIVIGRVVYECLAENLDPYPRAPGAVLEKSEAAAPAGDGKPDSPFAVLANIKTKR